MNEDVSAMHAEHHERKDQSTTMKHISVSRVHSEVKSKSSRTRSGHSSAKFMDHVRVVPLSAANIQESQSNDYSSPIPTASNLTDTVTVVTQHSSLPKDRSIEKRRHDPRRSNTFTDAFEHIKVIAKERKHTHQDLRRRSYSDVTVGYIPKSKL